MGNTALEIMLELQKDSDFQQRKKEQDRVFDELHQKYASDERDLVIELQQVGLEVNSVWELMGLDSDYSCAESILQKHLLLEHHPRIKSGVVRSLANESFIKNDELWNTLCEMYSSTLPDRQIKEPEMKGVQESIATAIDELASLERLSELKAIISANEGADGLIWLKEKVLVLEQEM